MSMFDFIIAPFKGINSIKKGDFITRFLFWRKCTLGFATLFLLVIVVLNAWDGYKQVRDWRQQVQGVPKQVRTHFTRFIQAMIAGDVFICVCGLLAFVYSARSWLSNRSDFPKSVEMSVKAWLCYFFGPFTLLVAFPFAHMFRHDLLSIDLCTVTLVSVLSQGDDFRRAFAAVAVEEPELIYAAKQKPPKIIDDLKDLDPWAGRQWCKDNVWRWESKIYSSRWVRLSGMGVGLPTKDQVDKVARITNTHHGIVPPALMKLAGFLAIPMDTTFYRCIDTQTSLLETEGDTEPNFLDNIVSSISEWATRHDAFYKIEHFFTHRQEEVPRHHVDQVGHALIPNATMSHSSLLQGKSQTEACTLGSWEVVLVATRYCNLLTAQNKPLCKGMSAFLEVQGDSCETFQIKTIDACTSEDTKCPKYFDCGQFGGVHLLADQSGKKVDAGTVDQMLSCANNDYNISSTRFISQEQTAPRRLARNLEQTSQPLRKNINLLRRVSSVSIDSEGVVDEYSKQGLIHAVRGGGDFVNSVGNINQRRSTTPIGTRLVRRVSSKGIKSDEAPTAAIVPTPDAEPNRSRAGDATPTRTRLVRRASSKGVRRDEASVLAPTAAIVPTLDAGPSRSREYLVQSSSLVEQLAQKQQLNPADIPASANPVCIAYASSIGLLRSAKLVKKSIHAALGFIVSLLVIKTLFPATGAVVTGISTAVFSVKQVLPSASLPGYFLMVATVSYLPPFMLFMAMLSQTFGNPFISVAIFLMCASAAANLHKGKAMIEAHTKKQVKKMNKVSEEKVGQARMLAVAIVLLWAGYKIYQILAGGPEAEDIQEAFMFIDWKELFMSLPSTIAQMVVVSLMYRFLTEVACTDVLLTAIFDAADDELRAKNKGEIDEDRNELLKDWQEIYPPREKDDENEKKKKKKKKKGKKEKDDKQEKGSKEYGEDSPEQMHPQSQTEVDMWTGSEASGSARTDAPSDPRGGYFPSYH